jgi:lysozyme
MEPRHSIAPPGIALIKSFEGLRHRAARLPDGRFTVGYGHTRSAREGAEVDEADAEALLRYDLQPVEAAVNACIYTPLTQNQYDALVAFAFSVGVETFRGSNVLRRVNEGDLLAAAAALESWRRAEFEGEVIVVDALIRRRAAEKALFLTPADGFIASPSTVLRPQMDFGAPVLREGPQSAAEILTALTGDAVSPERTPPADNPFAMDPELSPAQAAADAVSRRLQALFADDPAVGESARPATPTERAPETIAELAPSPWDSDPSKELPPPALVEVLTHPTPADLSPSREPDTFDRRIARADPDASSLVTEPVEARGPYLILGLIGLILFVLGVLIILQGQRAGETGLLDQRSAAGSLLGLIGIGAFCTAVYEWLKTLGRNQGGENA